LAKSIATDCPICGGELVISRLSCLACQTRIETELPFAALTRLPEEMREFVLIFLRCRGNIREVEKELGISYPTVCKRLDLVNDLIAGNSTGQTSKRLSRGDIRGDILAKLEGGEITAKEAANLLKGR
jgi:hypothetical protein